MLAQSTRALFQMAAQFASSQLAGMFGGGATGGASSAAGGAAFSAQVAVAGTTFATAVTTAGASFAATVAGGAAAGAAGSSSGGWAGIISAAVGWFAGGYATGGDFTVPGTGGPDSKLVSMRLTPGERVSVQTPEQQRAADAGAQQPQTQVAQQSIRVVNVVDPNETLTALGSDAGERIVLNIIERNPQTVQRLLNR